MDHNELWKNLQEMEIPNHLIYLLQNLYAGQEATVELDMELWTSSKLGKEYVKAVHGHPTYLTHMQSKSCEMLGWMNHSWNQGSWEKHQQPQTCR